MGRTVISETENKQTIILNDSPEGIEGGYFDSEMGWHVLGTAGNNVFDSAGNMFFSCGSISYSDGLTYTLLSSRVCLFALTGEYMITGLSDAHPIKLPDNVKSFKVTNITVPKGGGNVEITVYEEGADGLTQSKKSGWLSVDGTFDVSDVSADYMTLNVKRANNQNFSWDSAFSRLSLELEV